MKDIVKTALFYALISSASAFAGAETCKEGDLNCQAINPFEVCKNVDPSFDRSKLQRDDTLAMQYDACIAVTRIQCVEAGEVFLKTYRIILEAYTGDSRKNLPTSIGLVGQYSADEINLNIFDNFRALKAKQAEIFSEISKAQADFQASLESVQTLEDAQSKRESLYRRVKSIKVLLAKASHHDRVFMNLINQSEEDFRNLVISSSVILSRTSCNVLKEPVDKVYKNTEEFSNKVSALKRYVAKSTIKRSLALEKFRRGMELAIYSKYGERVGKDLDQIMDEIGADFALDAILWEVTEWWSNKTVNGLAGRLHTDYLQYRRPLEIMQALIGKADEFKSRIMAIQGLDISARNLAIATIDEKIKTINKDRDFVIGRGWAGQLERQKIFANKRVSLIPLSNVACHEATAKFLTLANESSSFDKYELAEAHYKIHFDACAKKG